MDIATALTRFWPDTRWQMDGDKYEGLEWLSDAPKPSREELEAAWETIKDERPPDVPGFRGAMLEALGLRRANTLMRDYPAFLYALDVGNYPVARDVLHMAMDDGMLTTTEQDAVTQAMEKHHIP